MTKSRGINRPKHRWTKRELAILRRRYPHERTSDIADDLGLPLANVYAYAGNMRLRKSAAFQASDKSWRIFKGGTLGQATQFKPCQVPPNKGLRRPGYAPGRMAETQFKKGQRGNKWVPLGTERINCDGYRDRKIREDLRGSMNWRAVHVLLWEEAHGLIPPKHLVVFKDGDKTNVVIQNLELITMTENGRRNVMWRKYPKQLADVLQLRGSVQRQINRRLGRRQEKNRERREATRRAIRNARRAARQGQSDGHRAGESGCAGR